jgi:hypothetical protein
MTEKEAIDLLKTETEVIALNERAFLLFLLLGMKLLMAGVPVAKVTKGY